ncbi:hypothetical protein RYX36_012303 [Vicia faba]
MSSGLGNATPSSGPKTVGRWLKERREKKKEENISHNAQVHAAEAMGAEREHLASVVSSAVNVRSYDDITTLTAAAATALRGTTTLKARALKEMWNISVVTPLEKSIGIRICGGKANTNSSSSTSDNGGEIINADNFLSACSQELLARGTELLKRTRKGSDLHWKIVSVYIHRTGQVMLKMKSRHVAGTITKKKKSEL